MKKLITITAALALFLGFSHNANAQLKIGVSGTFALPMSDFGDLADPGFGGQLNADYFLSDNLSVGLEIGYMSYAVEVLDANFTLMPIQVNGEYHLMPGEMMDFYGGLGVGITVGDSDIDGAESTTDLGITPRIGGIYNINDQLGIDLNVRYGIKFDGDSDADIANTQYVGINLGVVYSLN